MRWKASGFPLSLTCQGRRLNPPAAYRFRCLFCLPLDPVGVSGAAWSRQPDARSLPDGYSGRSLKTTVKHRVRRPDPWPGHGPGAGLGVVRFMDAAKRTTPKTGSRPFYGSGVVRFTTMWTTPGFRSRPFYDNPADRLGSLHNGRRQAAEGSPQVPCPTGAAAPFPRPI